MKKIATTILALVLALLPINTTFAHVLSEDQTDSKGALLHIMPDDNPTVGQPATIYFDLQGFEDEDINDVSLDVLYGGSILKTLTLNLTGTTASGDFTFDTAGTYELKLDVHTSDDVHSFSFQQVVAGAGTSLSDQLFSNGWALVLLVLCSIGVGVLVVLFVLKRKDVAKRSVGV